MVKNTIPMQEKRRNSSAFVSSSTSAISAGLLSAVTSQTVCGGYLLEKGFANDY